MKIITLNTGKQVKVDADDYEFLSQWKWSEVNGYASRSTKVAGRKNRAVLMHRVILGLSHGDPRHADHINHDRLDNRKRNLRVVTASQNCHNRRLPSGVTWNRSNQQYEARVCIRGERHWLGLFRDPDEAQVVVDEFRAANV